MELLSSDTDLAEIYKVITQHIIDTYHQ
jgi:hypothetical protein